MENEKSVKDEFLGDLQNDGSSDPFEQPKDDLFNEEKVEEDKVEEKGDEKEEKIPFHKDPKLQRYIEKEISKRIPEAQQTEVKKFVEETKADEIDDVLTRIIGNDTQEKILAIRDFKKVLLEREERGAQRALEKLEAQREAEARANREAEETLVRGFDDIEENFNVDLTSRTPNARKLRGEFIDFIERIAPKDTEGDIIEFPDLQETFKLFQEGKKAPSSNSRAKDLASRSSTRSGDASEAPKQEDKSWNAVDRIFDKLLG